MKILLVENAENEISVIRHKKGFDWIDISLAECVEFLKFKKRKISANNNQNNEKTEKRLTMDAALIEKRDRIELTASDDEIDHLTESISKKLILDSDTSMNTTFLSLKQKIDGQETLSISHLLPNDTTPLEVYKMPENTVNAEKDFNFDENLKVMKDIITKNPGIEPKICDAISQIVGIVGQ